MKIYTGVGSRDLPEGVYELLQGVAFKLAQEGWLLRSGAADGADSAFEEGCDEAGGGKEIYIAWNGFSGRYADGKNVFAGVTQEALHMASEIHPAWDKLKQGGQKLHARNCYQVLGRELDMPSQMLICWAKTDKHGDALGGTRTAWMLAKKHGIRCFNLNIPADAVRIKAWLG